MPASAKVDWSFGGAWPFQPHWFATRDGQMHYIDEGPRDGRPVVLVHGNPTWGFVYRNFVGPLTAAGHRVIVPDHLGFGRSDKPHDARLCTIARHIERFDALLESLDLNGATVVPCRSSDSSSASKRSMCRAIVQRLASWGLSERPKPR